jgi:predicted acyltransferase
MDQLGHVEWTGFNLWDLIMPLFIFMCGAAVPFALGKRLDNGKPTAAYWKHVGARFAILWFFGMLVQGRFFTYDPDQFMYFSNTLQTIAIGYVVAAGVFLIKSRNLRLSIAALTFIIYGALVHFLGDYSQSGNLAMKVDKAIFGFLLPDTNPMMKETKYAWVLPSFMYAAMTILGMESAKLLTEKKLTKWLRAGILGAASVAILGAGFLTSLKIPVIKPIFTVSFTLLAIGWSMLALTILYIITDIFKFRFGLSIPILFGQFALLAYMSAHLFDGAYRSIARIFTFGLEQCMTKEWMYVVMRVVMIGLMTYVLAIRRTLSKPSADKEIS